MICPEIVAERIVIDPRTGHRWRVVGRWPDRVRLERRRSYSVIDLPVSVLYGWDVKTSEVTE